MGTPRKIIIFSVLSIGAILASFIYWTGFIRNNHYAGLFQTIKVGDTLSVAISFFGPGKPIEISNLPSNLPHHQLSKVLGPRKWPPYSSDDKAFYWDFQEFEIILVFSKEEIGRAHV